MDSNKSDRQKDQKSEEAPLFDQHFKNIERYTERRKEEEEKLEQDHDP